MQCPPLAKADDHFLKDEAYRTEVQLPDNASQNHQTLGDSR